MIGEDRALVELKISLLGGIEGKKVSQRRVFRTSCDNPRGTGIIGARLPLSYRDLEKNSPILSAST